MEVADPSTSSMYLTVDTERSNQQKKTVVMELDYQLQKHGGNEGMSSDDFQELFPCVLSIPTGAPYGQGTTSFCPAAHFSSLPHHDI